VKKDFLTFQDRQTHWLLGTWTMDTVIVIGSIA